MSVIRVQCKGSGQQATNASLNSKKATCGHCGGWVALMSSGKMRKHMRVTTTAKLRKGR